MGVTLLYGTLLPDVLARMPPMVLARVDAHLVSLPKTVIYGWDPLHIPAGMVCVAWLVALLYPRGHRWRAFGWLCAGMGLHLGVDLLQDHLGVGYLLLWPLMTGTYELGWVGSEASVVVAPGLALLTAVVLRHRWRGSAPASG